MNLLFDGNISFRIVPIISNYFPGSTQLREHSLESSSDAQVWEFGRQNNLCIVTKNSDFNDLAIAKGFPPKVLWLKVGNCNTDVIANLFLQHRNSIVSFLEDDHSAILVLN